MSLIGIILLFLFIWYVVRPAVKFFMTVNRLRDEARSAYQNRAPRPQNERKAGWTAPVRRKKKIDRNVGEYIEYEEITRVSAPNAPNQSGQSGYTFTEEQITDVEWEDIK